MNNNLSAAMRQSIEDAIRQVQADGCMLDVSKVAEKIRYRHIADNVALEDIAAALFAAGTGLPMQIGEELSEIAIAS